MATRLAPSLRAVLCTWLRPTSGAAVAWSRGGLALLVVLGWVSAAPAALVRNLSTGIDAATGSLLPGFTPDPNYRVTGPDGQPYYGQARGQNNLPNSYLNDAALPGSRWDYLVTNPNDTGAVFVPVGNYTWQTSVDLTGFDPTTARIGSLAVSADNAFLTVAVNGTTAFTHTPTGDVIEEFGFIQTLPADLGLGLFHAGTNTVTFTIFNQGFGGDGSTIPSPAAFRAQGEVDATPLVGSVPEPTSLLLLGVGVGGLAVFSRCRRQTIA